jgi:hypothetical protein
MSKPVEQNTIKGRGVGMRVCDPERAFPGFTLFAPHFEQNREVYLVDLDGEVVHTWRMPMRPAYPVFSPIAEPCSTTVEPLNRAFSAAFRSRAGSSWKPTGTAKSCGKSAIPTTQVGHGQRRGAGST